MKSTVLYGAWPWGWTAEMINALVPDKPKPAPKPKKPKPAPPKLYKLVDLLADHLSLSRAKVRWEVMHGRVLIGGVVEQDADRMVPEGTEIEWISSS